MPLGKDSLTPTSEAHQEASIGRIKTNQEAKGEIIVVVMLPDPDVDW
jgi:hypothetical protein